MAIFGRHSAADDRRADRARRWVQARSPGAIVSLMFGLLAVLDAFTGVLGVLLGVVAVVAGVLGLRDLSRRPEKSGKRLCYTGIILGLIGIAAGTLVWTILS